MLDRLKTLKDKALSKGAEHLLRERLAPYGTLCSLSIDTLHKRIRLQLELHGDPQRLNVFIEGYQIEKEESGYILKIRSFETSREWITKLGEKYLKDRPIPIDEKVATALRLLA